MEKVKKIFSPGSSKDDEIMYGSQSTSKTSEEGKAASSEPVPEKKEHGVLRQILNPNNSNYDEVAYGKPVEGAAEARAENPAPLQTLPEAQKEHGVLRQVLNPHGDKYDETAYGTTAVATDEAPSSTQAAQPKEHGVLRQILNPNSSNYDELAYGKPVEGAAQTRAENAAPLETLPDAQKEHGVLRQVLNPHGDKYDETAYGATAVAAGTASQPSATQTPSTTQNTTTTSIGGSHNITSEAPQSATAAPGTTLSSVKPDDDQKSAMSIKSGVEGPYASTDTPSIGVQPSSTGTATAASATSGQQSETAREAFGAHFGQDAALAGAGLAGAGVASSELGKSSGGTTTSSAPQGPWSKPGLATSLPEQSEPNDSSSRVATDYEDRFRPSGTSVAENPQVNRAPADVEQATYTARSYKLADGSSSGAAGAPHVPGEFPLETGEDPHRATGDPATAAARTAMTGAGDAPSQSTSGGTHYGRDAAVAGAAGAAGAGAYEASKSSGAHPDTTNTTSASGTVGSSGVQSVPTSSASHTQPTATAVGTAAAAAPESSTRGADASYPAQQGTEHHLGRDAAIAGGAGAAGAGIYEASKGGDSTGPASKTIGPHESNVANVVDPRVQPQPSQLEDKIADKHAAKEEGKDAKAQEKAQEKAAKEHEKEVKAQEKAQEKEAKKEAKEHEKALKAQEKAQEKEAKKEAKEHEKELKIQEKEAKKEAKVQEKEAKKEAKAHEKEVAAQEKEAKAQEKAHEKELKAQQKEAEKAAKEQEKDESHLGRDAAVAGGAGAAGVGAYELAKDHDDTGPASKTIGPHESNAANIADPRVQPDPEKMKESTTSGPHRSDIANKLDPRVDSDPAKTASQEQGHGTVAAESAGTTGVAGADAFEASGIARRDTGPASKTIGPHDSNVLNVLDPRVKPDTSLMKEEQPITAGPHRSDIANILDPRVDSSLKKSQDESHTGRDAAIGAGVGAGVGTAAYEAEKKNSQSEDASSDSQKHKHNKLQKPRPEEASEKSSEKSEKQGFLSKILHPGRKSSEGRRSSDDTEQTAGAATAGAAATGAANVSGDNADKSNVVTEPHTGLPMDVGKYGHGVGGTDGTPQIVGYHETGPNTGVGSTGASDALDGNAEKSKVVIEPHTGLPMDIGKYGEGAGGTDGAPQIGGYHETDPAIREATVGTAQGGTLGEPGVAGPDLDAIKKQNTIY